MGKDEIELDGKGMDKQSQRGPQPTGELPQRRDAGILGVPLQVEGQTSERYKLLTDLANSWRNIDSHRVMWNDQWDKRVRDRDPVEIKTAIDEHVKMFGGLDQYRELTEGADPYAHNSPVCGSSAQNLYKLMTEKNAAVDPTKEPMRDSTEFAGHLDSLDPNKNYVMLIDDKRLGHKYVIDLPASSGGRREGHISGVEHSEIGEGTRPRNAFILQSDLGDGVLPKLSIEDWIRERGNDKMNIEELKQLISPDFITKPSDTKRQLLASVLDIKQDATRITDELLEKRLNSENRCLFASREYDFEQFRQNVQHVCEVGQEHTQTLAQATAGPSQAGAVQRQRSSRSPSEIEPRRRAGSPSRASENTGDDRQKKARYQGR